MNAQTNKQYLIQKVWAHKVLQKIFLEILTNTQLHNERSLKRKFIDKMNELVPQGLDDDSIYKEFFSFIHVDLDEHLRKKIQHKERYRVTNRVQKILHFIYQFGTPHIPIQSILDIGCDHGDITGEIGKKLELQRESVHGCDIINMDKQICENFTYHEIKESDKAELPFSNDSQDIVYAFMSLHHIKNIHDTLKEIYRVLKPQGLFIIREHDSTNRLEGYKDVLDIIHGFYSMVWSNPNEKECFSKEHWAHYFTSPELIMLIRSFGFHILLDTSFPKQRFPQYYNRKMINPLRYYYAVFKK